MFTMFTNPGITWHSYPTVNPVFGDIYYDTTTGTSMLWDGSIWTPISTGIEYDIPTEAQLEKHPSLKAAWNDYMIIRRLLGICHIQK